MKNIAVLVHSLTVEYAAQVVSGITSFFKDKDVKVILFQLNDPYSTYGIFDHQNWSATEYLKSDEIDGIIILAGTFSVTIPPEVFRKVFEKIDKPVVSISIELGLKNETTALVDCEKVYSDAIQHFVKKHNCKKVAFLSANKTISKEAVQRFEAYKNALKENNLEYDEALIFDGSFTQDSGYDAVKEKIKSREDLYFDAMIIANDFMALGALKAFQEVGIDIPNELKLLGFDNTSHSYTCKPTISTVDQNIFLQGTIAAQTMLKKLNGEKVPNIIKTPLSLIFRQSCGCVDTLDFSHVYKNQEGKEVIETFYDATGSQGDERFYNLIPKVETIFALFDMFKSTNSLQELFYVMKYCFNNSNITKSLIYLYSKPKKIFLNGKLTIPSKVQLNMFIDNENDIQQFSPYISINPSKQLFPPNYLKDEPGVFLFQTIYSAEKNYGFMISKLGNEYFSLYPLYLKILVSAISNSYEYTQIVLNNTSLDVQSKTDELTKVLNRRGFLELGQKSVDIALEMNNMGVIFFVDMDGLKKINDTYGHNIGDEAIKTQALVLKKALRMNDVVGRIGGDEFVAVATGMTLESLPKIRKKIEKLNITLSAEKNLPFTLSCSIGAIPFSCNEKKLAELLLDADALLYEEKRKKKESKQIRF